MQNQKRWGILALAVVMFLAILIAMQIFGNLLSMFGAAWIMIGWYAYKGDLQSAFSWSKWAIFVGIGVIFLSYFFIGDNNNPVTLRVKNQSAVGVGVMAVPLIMLYFYLVGQVTKIANNAEAGGDKNFNSKNNFNPTPNIYSASISALRSKPSSFTSPVHSSTLPTANDEVYFERALEEFDTHRRKGLWIKLLTQNEGDEVKSKFQYIKARAQGIQLEDADQKLKNQPNLIAVKTEAATDDSRKLASLTANNNYKPAVHQEISSLQLKEKLKFTSHKEYDDIYTTLKTGLLDSEKEKFEIKFKFDYQHRSILHIASQVYILANDENAKYACIGTCTAMNKNDILNFIEYLLEVPIDNANAAADQRKKLLIEKVDRIMNGHALGLTANSENAWMQAIASKNIDAAYKLFNSSIIKSA